MEIRASAIFSTVFVLITFIGLGMWGCPQYAVYSNTLGGTAELKRAEQNRQIRINEAMARKEAAQFEADAEVIRAHGIAEANKIIAEGLGGPDGYLRYLYIDMLREQEGGNQIIYIPTEAGLPVLEAGRLNGSAQ